MSDGIIKNSTIVISSILIASISVYLFQIISARILGPEQYGVFGALLALFMILAFPAQSITTSVSKFVSKLNKNQQFNMIGILRKKLIKQGLIYSITISIILILFHRPLGNYLKVDSLFPFLIIGGSLIFITILSINRGIIQGMKKYKVYGLNFIAESFLRLLILISLLYAGIGYNGALFSYGLAYFLAFLFIFPYIKETKSKNFYNIKIDKMYKFFLLVLFLSFLIQMIINLPTIFIKHFFSSEFTGYWTAALNLARITLFFVTGISFVMFPEIAERKNSENEKIIFNKSLVLSLVTSFGIAIIFFTIPKFFIIGIYGSKFLGAIPLLKWMGFAMIFISILQLYSNYWLAKLK